MAEYIPSLRSLIAALYRTLDTVPCLRLVRDDLHDIAERTVELLTDAHEYLERDELVFRELGERVGADADLAGEFGLVPAFVDELLEKAIVGNKHSRYLLLLFSPHYSRLSVKSK